MKALKLTFLLALALLPSSQAQVTRFFRVVGPAANTITGITVDGHITWTNVPANGTFTIQTAQSLLNPIEWVDYVHVSATNEVSTHSFYAFMALIPAGLFSMGDYLTNGANLDESPVHPVQVSSFYMDQYEVTLALWHDVRQWAASHGYSFDNWGSACSWPYEQKAANHPVTCLNWYDMVKWCNARSEQEGLTPCYYTDAEQTTLYKTDQLNLTNGCVKWNANGYRLPTEAEWEKAARGGNSGHRFPWAVVNTINQSRANYLSYWEAGNPLFPYDVNPTPGNPAAFNDGEFPLTNPVGYFPANGYGLHDMAGNVWESCWDRYDMSWYTNGAATQTDTRGPDEASSKRVRRGGCWEYDASFARCAERDDEKQPADFDNRSGFRCVRGL